MSNIIQTSDIVYLFDKHNMCQMMKTSSSQLHNENSSDKLRLCKGFTKAAQQTRDAAVFGIMKPPPAVTRGPVLTSQM